MVWRRQLWNEPKRNTIFPNFLPNRIWYSNFSVILLNSISSATCYLMIDDEQATDGFKSSRSATYCSKNLILIHDLRKVESDGWYVSTNDDRKNRLISGWRDWCFVDFLGWGFSSFMYSTWQLPYLQLTSIFFSSLKSQVNWLTSYVWTQL